MSYCSSINKTLASANKKFKKIKIRLTSQALDL